MSTVSQRIAETAFATPRCRPSAREERAREQHAVQRERHEHRVVLGATAGRRRVPAAACRAAPATQRVRQK